jgi:threonine dehydrogenase-like Zn-dependent dehydrogenase
LPHCTRELFLSRRSSDGKERMRRLMSVISSGRGDLKSLVTHRYKLADIVAAYDLFAHQRDGVLKVAITP